MRGFVQVALVFLSVLLTAVTTGCVHSRAYQYTDAPQGQIFLSSSPSFDASALLAKWSSSPTEHDKINYLLDRIASSQCRFIRNGETYDGKEARQWFLYKMVHWVDHVETAQDFLTRVAGFSQKTGEPYVVEFPDGKIYSLKSILKNELSRFERQFSLLNERRLETASQAKQISLSPTTVATNAVATSTSS